MSREETSVQPVRSITRKTELRTLPDIDPEAVAILADQDITTIGHLRRSTIDIALVINRGMARRPRTASESVHTLLLYKNGQLPKQANLVHDRMPIANIDGLPPEVIQALHGRGMTTLGQVRSRRSQIPNILQQSVPRHAREAIQTITRYLSPELPPASVSA